MNRDAKLIGVLRALALMGGVSVAACNRTTVGSTNGNNGAHSDPGSSIAGTACGATAPSNGTSCEGHQVGHECEWYGAVRCTCVAGPQGPQWGQCMARAVPGPLPPPELSA